MAPDDMTPEQWLRLMPLPAVRAKVEALEAESHRIAADLQMWRELLALRSPRAALTQEPTLMPLNGTKPTVRQAIAIVLTDEGHSMAPAAIRKKLISRGWVQADRNGASQVYAMLSRMTKAGQVTRRGNGNYYVTGGGE
jgi:hypothetical protein